MDLSALTTRAPRRALLALGAALAIASAVLAGGAMANRTHRMIANSGPGSGGDPISPIKHVIVIIGQGHTFDNVFATYQPSPGQSVLNMLSEGIVTASGDAGANVAAAVQRQATDTGTYSPTPTETGQYLTLPQPNTTDALGQPQGVPDVRFPANLANAPYEITKYVPYLGSYVGAPLDRFYQMYQQVSEGHTDLFTWVANTAGDDNGAMPPAAIHQGALAMGYYNVAEGDSTTFNSLAHQYAMSDNYHQGVMGGVGPNDIMLGSGDAAFYSDGHGNALVPPANEIENPNAKPGTNNNYTQDGYSGGTYSNCSDSNQPGVGPVLNYLSSLSYRPFMGGDCSPGHYYLLNNFLPGYTSGGLLVTGNPFVVPPQTMPTIADELSANNISWGYFGQGYDGGTSTAAYCGICDPFQYATSVMTTSLKTNLHDSSDFDTEVANGTLPAVSFLTPDAVDDGHAASSSLSLFEAFAAHAVTEVQSNSQLWNSTAIFVTFANGGGYYDSGYIQPISFFGDGPRVPMIAISPFAKPGYVSHTYTDTASIVKFIERNWQLSPLSARSLDNLPNPTPGLSGPYVPGNRPAIGDLFDLFDLDRDLGLTNLPQTITADATSPTGAVVRYTNPTVIDEDNPTPSVNCAPVSGSKFDFGLTNVTCVVNDSDDSNGPVRQSFLVLVKGAADQLTDLYGAVVGSGDGLTDRVEAARADIARGNVARTCSALSAFIHAVRARAGKSIQPGTARLLIADARRIEAVLGCTGAHRSRRSRHKRCRSRHRCSAHHRHLTHS
jgi:phospholipase C